MFNWRMSEGYAYWPLWARQAGSMLQLIPILIIPAVGLIQCIRYLSSGPSDLFDVRLKYEDFKLLSFITNLNYFNRGLNYFTGQTFERTSYRASRLPALRPDLHAVSKGANEGDRVALHVHAHVRHRLILQHFPIHHPNTLRLRRTTQPLERGKNSNSSI